MVKIESVHFGGPPLKSHVFGIFKIFKDIIVSNTRLSGVDGLRKTTLHFIELLLMAFVHVDNLYTSKDSKNLCRTVMIE
jgi:hypothetical protein